VDELFDKPKLFEKKLEVMFFDKSVEFEMPEEDFFVCREKNVATIWTSIRKRVETRGG